MEKMFYTKNIAKQGGSLVGTFYVSMDPDKEVEVPLTKKILQKAIEDSVAQIRELEVLLNTKLSDFDNFMKAAFVAHIMYYVEFIPVESVYSKFPEVPEPEEGTDLEDLSSKKCRDWIKKCKERDAICDEIEFNFGEQLKKEIPSLPLSAEEFIKKVGSDKIAELWDYDAYRWGWSMSDFLEISDHFHLETKDIISNSEKFKRAVVAILAVNMYDELVMALAQGDNQGDYSMTLEEVLALPKE